MSVDRPYSFEEVYPDGLSPADLTRDEMEAAGVWVYDEDGTAWDNPDAEPKTNHFRHDGKKRTKGEPTLEIINAAELVRRVAALPPPTFLANPVWPSDAYGVLSAKWKAGKTWAEEDLAVSVACGGKWLEVFQVDRPGAVVRGHEKVPAGGQLRSPAVAS